MSLGIGYNVFRFMESPLTWLSFMFDYQLHGLNAGGYHLTNLILHIMSALLLFWLFNRMTGTIWRSAFVARSFRASSASCGIGCVDSRTQRCPERPLWMLTLCLYVYYTEKPVIKRYLPVVFSFVLALMSKPMVVTLPVILILLDYWPLNRLESRKIATIPANDMPISINKEEKKTKSQKESLKKNISQVDERKLSETRIAGIIPLWQLWEKIPFFILSAVLVFITLYNPNQQKTSLKAFPLISRLANAPVAFVTYLAKTFWPNDYGYFLSLLRPTSGLAGFGGHHSDYSYQRCRYCNGKTFALSVCWMDVVCDNPSAGYRNHSGRRASRWPTATITCPLSV